MKKLTTLVMMAFLIAFAGAAYAAKKEKVVPYQYISTIYPPVDNYSTAYPDFFLTPRERLRFELQRLGLFKRRYGLEEVVPKKPKSKTLLLKEDKKKAKRKRPPRIVLGFYIDKESKLPIVNVNGTFHPLRKVLKTSHYKVLKVETDIMFVRVNGRLIKLEAGRPVPRI